MGCNFQRKAKMKTNRILTVLALTLVLILTLTGGGFASSDRSVDSLIVPMDLNAYIPCAAGGTGEQVLLTGNLHIVISWISEQSGGYHFIMHQYQGVSGYGSKTGDKYQLTGGNRMVSNALRGPTVFTYTNTFNIIGQGPGNNAMLHVTYHLSSNEAGEITAWVDRLSVDCK
jgi:hypothetical protein